MLNISILGITGDFEKNSQGSGARKYISEIYNNIKDSRPFGVNISKVELNNQILGIRTMPIFPSNLVNRYTNVDIIHNIRSNLLCAPFRSKKPIILNTAYEMTAITHPEFVAEDFLDIKMKIGSKAYLILHQMAEKAILNTDYLIAISTLTYNDLVDLGYNKDRIFIVPLGIDERFSIKKTRKKNKLFTVGYLGSLIRKKNLLFAINAFKLVEDPHIQMDVWGKKIHTGFYSKIEMAAASDKRIILHGFAPEEKIIDIYDSFDVLVYPVLRGGFELGIFEAQARGIPVIIYKKSEIPAEVKKYCLKAQNEEEMAALINKIKEDGYNESLKKKAMAYARSFTWKKTAKNTLNVYKRIAEREEIY